MKKYLSAAAIFAAGTTLAGAATETDFPTDEISPASVVFKTGNYENSLSKWDSADVAALTWNSEIENAECYLGTKNSETSPPEKYTAADEIAVELAYNSAAEITAHVSLWNFAYAAESLSSIVIKNNL